MSPFPPEPLASSQRRRFGRMRCQRLQCSVGEVLDLSGGGMRVRSRGPIALKDGATVDLLIETIDPPVALQCRVVWVRQAGWKLHEIGLMFVDPTPAVRKALSDLARGLTLQGEPVSDHESPSRLR